MKRQIQKTGVRKFFGQDFIDLQAEPLKALDAFFAEYGACIIEGCAVTEADGGRFNVAPGLVALESTDPDSGVVAVRTMPFAGAEGVALPLYLVAEWTVVERAYGDGKVKPIGYNLRAVASGVVPEGPHLVLTDAGGNRFVDAVQDGTHRFITDAERSKWNDVLRQAQEYSTTQAETAKRSAIEHTDGQVAAVRDELAVGDQAALRSAKEYADRIVAALVDGSPEMLNTLEELAAALGGDPNFATTVMKAIGERATKTEVAAKADATHAGIAQSRSWIDPTNDYTFGGWLDQSSEGRPMNHCQGFSARTGGLFGVIQLAAGMLGEVYAIRSTNSENDKTYHPWRRLFHSGNLLPATSVLTGLMSAADKAALDRHVASTGNPHGVTAAQVGAFPKWANGALSDMLALSGSGIRSFFPDTPNNSGGYTYGLAMDIENGDWHFRLAFDTHTNNIHYYRRVNAGKYQLMGDLHHSGNLKIIRGSVNANGSPAGGSGFGATPEGTLVKITHDLGTGYCFTGTIHRLALAGLQLEIYEKGNNYLKVGVRKPDGNYAVTGFDFMLSSY